MSSLNKSVLWTLAVLAIVGCGYVAPCFAEPINLIQNGGFETPDKTPASGVYTIPTSDTSMQPWTVLADPGSEFAYLVAGTVSGYLNAEEGRNRLDILFSSHRGVQQTFQVTAGQTYDVSFYEAAYVPSGTALPLDMTLTAAAGTLTGVNGNLADWAGSGPSTALFGRANGGAGSWTQFTYSFTPSNSGDVTLKFSYTTFSSSRGAFLDNVSVVPVVPEPGTLVLLAAGLAGLLCYAWRKR